MAVHQGRIFVSDTVARFVRVFDVPQGKYFKLGDDPSPEKRDIDKILATTTLAYGITRDLSASLEWLLAGEVPFPGSPERQILQHHHADRPDVRDKAAGVSDLTAKTLLKCMQIDPAERYADARALVHSLERNLDHLDQPQRDTEPVAKAAGSSSLILEEPDLT